MFNRTKDLRLSIIKQMELRAAQYPDVISLAQGIPSFDTPPGIKRRVENALKRGVVAKYSLSPGLPELRELIEISLSKDNMFYDWQTEILVTAGSIEGISATILAITDPGDEIIVPEPTYTSYREVIIMAGCKPVFVSLDEAKRWSLDIDKIQKAITARTKAIFFCNPNNPTGIIFSKNDLIRLGDIAKKNNIFLISDEVYKDFIYNDKDYKDEKSILFSLAEMPEYRERMIRIFSFSKAYAMTGWRVGYLHSDESIVREITKIHDSLVTCAPVISQYAAMGALEMAQDDVLYFKNEFHKRRDMMCARLDRHQGKISYVKPDSAYYVFPKFNYKSKYSDKNYPNSNSWNFALELLDIAQIALVPGFAFGPSGENHLRLSFGRSEKDINDAFDRLDIFISKYL